MTTPDPNHEPTGQHVTAVEQALRAAGAEITRAFSDAGLRIVATAALGQVMAGLPDAARGMIEALTDQQQHELLTAVDTLHELVSLATPEGKAATRDHAETTEFEAHSITLAGIYRYALLGQYADVRTRLTHLGGEDWSHLRRAAVDLIAVIDSHPTAVQR